MEERGGATQSAKMALRGEEAECGCKKDDDREEGGGGGGASGESVSEIRPYLFTGREKYDLFKSSFDLLTPPSRHLHPL